VNTAHSQQFQARKVIIAIPGPAYKNISFDPPLPEHMQTYSTAIRCGCYVKYVCLFKTPFWREKGFCGLSQSFKGPLSHSRDTSVDSQGNYALTCFITSSPGREWLRLNGNDRQEAVIKQLGSLFSVGDDKVRSELTGTITTNWHQDKWAGWGCPFACPPPGTIGIGNADELCNPKFGGITIVGTEWTNEWRGYMEGALRSGKRGAALVVSDFHFEDSNL
jgi:monoamine oxidase